MAPSVRHRLNSIKSDSSSGPVKKLNKKSSKEHNASKKNQNSSSAYPLNTSQVNTIVPGVDTAFKVFLSARSCSAIWGYISDCDETFNYWEPLHYMIYGLGLQTWEYSPLFALRSYTYLMVHAVPAWIYNKIFDPSPILVFYFVRCMLGLGCAVVECYMYKFMWYTIYSCVDVPLYPYRFFKLLFNSHIPALVSQCIVSCVSIGSKASLVFADFGRIKHNKNRDDSGHPKTMRKLSSRRLAGKAYNTSDDQ